jgi:hypothetical protein
MNEKLFSDALNANQQLLEEAEYKAGIKKRDDSNGAGAGAGAGAGESESKGESESESGEAKGRGKRRRETFHFSDKMDVQEE